MGDEPFDRAPVGLAGMGLMGTAFASRLLAAGYEVVGCDPDPDRRREHTERGGTVVESAGEVAARVPIMILSVLNNDIGREVLFGDRGVVSSGADDLLVLDTTTGHPEAAIEFATDLGAANIRFMDATMSGNSIQATAGDLVAILGGSAADADQAAPILSVLARSVHHVGDVGAAATAKLVVNLVLGVQRTVLAEGLVMGERAGLELEPLLGLLKDSAAYSKAMDLWGQRMVDGDFHPPGSRARQSHKDFKLITRYGQEIGSPTFLSSTVRQLLQVAESTGLGDLDNAGAIELQRRLAGVGRIDPEPNPGPT